MSDARRRWDERYQTEPVPHEPAPFVVDHLAPFLEEPGAALDVAGGAGRNSVWLAKRGWDVTLVDISSEAVRLSREAADRSGLTVRTIVADLATEPPPVGPWDLVLVVHYLQRELFPLLIESLTPGGVLAVSIATRRNLERHRRPPLPHLLEAGEALTLIHRLEIVSATEGWYGDRHEARVIARRR